MMISPEYRAQHAALTRALYLSDLDRRIASGETPAWMRPVAERVIEKPRVQAFCLVAAYLSRPA